MEHDGDYSGWGLQGNMMGTTGEHDTGDCRGT